MSTFDEDEKSVSANRPIDLFTITTPTATYLHTSHPVDVSYAGNVYTAITMSRGEQQVTQDPTGRELIVYLPITHPMVQRFAASGIPQHGIKVNLLRLQTSSGAAHQQFDGFATGINVQGHTAAIRCPSVTDDALKIQLPVIRAQKTCNHVLFDKQCSPNPPFNGPREADFSSGSQIVSYTITPGVITLVVGTTSGHPSGFFSFGRMIHTATQQSVLILQQTSTTFLLETPIIGAQIGDEVEFVAGCLHDVVTCNTKFFNLKNFGGMPQMGNNQLASYAPTSTLWYIPHLPSLGEIQQS